MKERIVNSRWALFVADNVADWDAPSMWEFPRFESLHRNIHYGDVVFDIGVEHGWISAIIARYFCGPENIVLFEPSPEFWVNIRRTWESNYMASPLDCWSGFVADHTEGRPVRKRDGVWPLTANPEGAECPSMNYRYYGRDREIPSITIDDYVKKSGNVPRVINIDVEGFELHVMSGARETVDEFQPLVWISIHPDLMEKAGKNDVALHRLMSEHGYDDHYLGTDHEQHWLFTPEGYA